MGSNIEVNQMVIAGLIPEKGPYNDSILERALETQRILDSKGHRLHSRNIWGWKRKLNSGRATELKENCNCVEGALFAAYNMFRHDSVDPRLLIIYNDSRKGQPGHAVYLFELDGSYYTINHSGKLRPGLRKGNSVDELVDGYVEELKSHGYDPMGHFVFDLEAPQKGEIGRKQPKWFDSKRDVSYLLKELCANHPLKSS